MDKIGRFFYQNTTRHNNNNICVQGYFCQRKGIYSGLELKRLVLISSRSLPSRRPTFEENG